MKKPKLPDLYRLLISVSLAWLIQPVHAGQGDIFYVTGSMVNVRAKATTESEIVTQASRGSEVEEIGRESGWVYVKIKDTNQTGWIHTALLNYRKPEMPADGNAQPAAKLEEKPKPALTEKSRTEEKAPESTDTFSVMFERFRANRQNAGRSLFMSSEIKGDGILHVMVSDDWVNISTAQREQDLKELFELWQSTRKGAYSAVYVLDKGHSIPAGIFIKDKQGKVQHAIRK